MKRELMESAGLQIYAEIGVVIFVIVFILILVRVFVMKKSEAEECSDIPLEDDIPASEAVSSESKDTGHDQGGLK